MQRASALFSQAGTREGPLTGIAPPRARPQLGAPIKCSHSTGDIPILEELAPRGLGGSRSHMDGNCAASGWWTGGWPSEFIGGGFIRNGRKLASRGAAMLQPEAGMVVEGWGYRSSAVGSAGLLLVAHGSRFGNDPAIGKLAKALSPNFSEVAFCVLRGRPTPGGYPKGYVRLSRPRCASVDGLRARRRTRSKVPAVDGRKSASPPASAGRQPSGAGRSGLRQHQPDRRGEPDSAPANGRHPGRSRQRAEPRLSIRGLPPGEHSESLRLPSRRGPLRLPVPAAPGGTVEGAHRSARCDHRPLLSDSRSPHTARSARPSATRRSRARFPRRDETAMDNPASRRTLQGLSGRGPRPYRQNVRNPLKRRS